MKNGKISIAHHLVVRSLISRLTIRGCFLVNFQRDDQKQEGQNHAVIRPRIVSTLGRGCGGVQPEPRHSIRDGGEFAGADDGRCSRGLGRRRRRARVDGCRNYRPRGANSLFHWRGRIEKLVALLVQCLVRPTANARARTNLVSSPTPPPPCAPPRAFLRLFICLYPTTFCPPPLRVLGVNLFSVVAFKLS